MNDSINLWREAFPLFRALSRRTVTRFNGHDIYGCQGSVGEFVWHKHDETDDFFWFEGA